ncbi:MAG: hypothetical protein K2Q22_03735, partial [Cytophagales bacterium]|nr:hypothetical protein [Cytophagales bacterium]
GRLYVLFGYELLVDEAFSYVYFISKGCWVTALYYPGPNNHVLYNLLCCIVDLLPISAYWVIKIPAFLLSMGIMALAYLYFNRKWGCIPAIAGVAILVSQELFISYTLLGRGYMLMAFAVLIGLISLDQWLVNGKKSYKSMFIISMIIGFYAVPVFFYPFCSFVIVGMISSGKTGDKRLRLEFVQAVFWVLVGVAGVYAPLVLFNGLPALISNPWVMPLAVGDFLPKVQGYLIDFYSTCTGLHFSGAVGVLVVLGWYLVKYTRFPAEYLLFYIVPVGLLLMQRVFPYDRVWVYFTVINSWLMAYIISSFRHKTLRLGMVTGILLLCVGLNIYHSYEKISGIARTDQLCKQWISMTRGPIFTNDDAYHIFLMLASQEQNSLVSIDYERFNSQIPYSMLILSKTLPPPQVPWGNYRVAMENEYIKLYKLKGLSGED